jgi:hypothetical protein
MSYKKRPKNKQELPSKSGKKRRKILPTKDIVEFEFIHNDEKYKNGTGRLKIATDGGISCLIFKDDKWYPVKATLTKIKLRTVVIKPKVK